MSNNIANRYRKLLRLIDELTPVLKQPASSNHHEHFLDKTARLNHFWNEWNEFWRTAWLVHVKGGVSKNRTRLPAIASYRTSEEYIYYINTLRAGSTPHFREPTWGGKAEILRIAGNLVSLDPAVLLPHSVFSSNVSLNMALVTHSIEDLRAVRNSSIHLNERGFLSLKSNLQPRYRTTNLKYPTDFLTGNYIGTNEIAIEFWMREIREFIVEI